MEKPFYWGKRKACQQSQFTVLNTKRLNNLFKVLRFADDKVQMIILRNEHRSDSWTGLVSPIALNDRTDVISIFLSPFR